MSDLRYEILFSSILITTPASKFQTFLTHYVKYLSINPKYFRIYQYLQDYLYLIPIIIGVGRMQVYTE